MFWFLGGFFCSDVIQHRQTEENESLIKREQDTQRSTASWKE